jgi:hypothetical protein
MMMMIMIAIDRRRCGRRDHRDHVGFFSRIFLSARVRRVKTKKFRFYRSILTKGNVRTFLFLDAK